MIYLASPYTGPDDVMEQRYALTCKACAGLVKKGFLIYSPIVHWHSIAVAHKLPRSHEFWRTLDYDMIRLSSGVIVLTIDGWQTSIGLSEDLSAANMYHKSVTYKSLEECIS